MKKINPYKGNSFDFHIEVVKSKHRTVKDPTYKDRIENLKGTIQKQFQEYDKQFSLDNLPILSPEALSPQEQADLKLLYKYDTKPFQKLNDILTTGENNTRQPLCPFCTINNVNTLDHLIPKTEFAEFSDHPFNLMPCCSDCNSKKSSNWRIGNERKYLNLYLDELPKIQYLFVSLSIVDSTIKAKFTIENRNHIEVTLFQKIINHYEDLELCNRFSLNCDNTISELKNLLKQIKIHIAKEKIIESIEKAEAENRNHYGYNYWKSLLIIECCKNNDVLDFLLI